MYDFEVAFYLYKMSRLLEVFEKNKYKSRAYFKAAMAVDSYSTFITEAYKTDRLKTIEGIGDSSARIIKAVLETGRCQELEVLEEKYNIEDYSLILSYGLSTSTIRKLLYNNIKTVSQLNDRFHSGIDILDLGKAEKIKIYQFLTKYKENCGYYLYSYAYCLQRELLALLNKDGDAKIAAVKTDVWKEKVNCISLICKADNYNYVKELLLSSDRYNNIVSSDDREIKCVTAFGIPVVITFGNFIVSDSAFLPVLRGDLHMHTKWSDGKHSI